MKASLFPSINPTAIRLENVLKAQVNTQSNLKNIAKVSNASTSRGQKAAAGAVTGNNHPSGFNPAFPQNLVQISVGQQGPGLKAVYQQRTAQASAGKQGPGLMVAYQQRTAQASAGKQGPGLMVAYQQRTAQALAGQQGTGLKAVYQQRMAQALTGQPPSEAKTAPQPITQKAADRSEVGADNPISSEKQNKKVVTFDEHIDRCWIDGNDSESDQSSEL